MATITIKPPDDRPAITAGSPHDVSPGGTFPEGMIFAGRYRIIKLIGEGGMGAVYECTHIETGGARALKVMRPHLLADPKQRERFALEARIAEKFVSDFVVEIQDAGFDRGMGMPFLVMPLLRGETLSDRLKRSGKLSSEDVVRFLHHAALALDKAHAAQVVHRDLKPDNLFIVESEDGRREVVKVLDFGIAKFLQENGAGALSTRGAVGTPVFMAPEQFKGEGICQATDIFALGMIAYNLLTGIFYWNIEMQAGLPALWAACVLGRKDAASTRAAREGIALPSAFDDWFAKATMYEPATRFGNASEAVAELAKALDVAPSSVGAPPRRNSEAGAASKSLPPDPLSLKLTASRFPTRVWTPTSTKRRAFAAGIFGLAAALLIVGVRAFLGPDSSAGITVLPSAAPSAEPPSALPFVAVPAASASPTVATSATPNVLQTDASGSPSKTTQSGVRAPLQTGSGGRKSPASAPSLTATPKTNKTYIIN